MLFGLVLLGVLSSVALAVLTTRHACYSSLTSYLSSLRESLSSAPDAYGQSLKALPSRSTASGSESRIPDVGSELEYPATVVVSDVSPPPSPPPPIPLFLHGAETHVHIPTHGGSEAQKGPPDSILSHKPKPLGKHKPLPPQFVWSPDELSCPP
ncbi:hypothetical protein Tco_0700224 [Tanacetum coccineum]